MSVWNFPSWLKISSSLTYIPVFWKFSKFWILQLNKVLFSKKVVFWNFRDQKLKVSQIRDSHLLDLFKYYLLCRFLAIRVTNVFLTNFQTFIFFRTKIAGGDVTKSAISQIFLPESDFSFTRRRRIDVRRVMPSFMSISARVQELFRKNRGGGRDKPPPQAVKG